VRLHYSWFVVPSLITLSLTSQFAALNRSWSPAIIWGLAALTAALFFVCIVLHELAHASVARLSGIPVRGITLFARGGIAQIEKELRSIVWAITHNCATVDATTMVRQFVDDQLMRMATRCFAVTQDGRVVGLITPEDVKHVERERWDRTRVSEAMRPLQSLHPVRPDASGRRRIGADGSRTRQSAPRRIRWPARRGGHAIVPCPSLAGPARADGVKMAGKIAFVSSDAAFSSACNFASDVPTAWNG
jgi:hypothetical protein